MPPDSVSDPHRIRQQLDLKVRACEKLPKHPRIVMIGVTNDSFRQLLTANAISNIGSHKDGTVDAEVPSNIRGKGRVYRQD